MKSRLYQTLAPIALALALACGAFQATNSQSPQATGSQSTTTPPHSASTTESKEQGRWGLRIRTAGRTFVVGPDGKLTRELPHSNLSGELSPDKTRLLAVRFEQGGFEIYVSAADGRRARRLTNGEMFDSEAHWSPDGKRIIFAAARSGAWGVYEMDADGRGGRKLSGDAEKAWKPQYTAEGRVSYLVTKGSQTDGKTLPLQDLVLSDGAASKTIAAGQLIKSFAWSPSGGVIAYSLLGDGGRLVILDVSSGERREIASAEIDPRLSDYTAREIRWRPDGKALAVRMEFTGGRAEGQTTESFGDRQLFIIPLEGKPAWFEVESGAQFEWVSLN